MARSLDVRACVSILLRSQRDVPRRRAADERDGRARGTGRERAGPGRPTYARQQADVAN